MPYMKIIPFQTEFRQELPTILGNVDYQRFREQLIRMDELLNQSQLDKEISNYLLSKAERRKKKSWIKKEASSAKLTAYQTARCREQACKVLRLGIARFLTGESYREFSCRLADSCLLRKFCMLDQIGLVKIPSKSTLERYEKSIPEYLLKKAIEKLVNKASHKNPGGEQLLGLQKEISISDSYLDTTCLKSNIHYPVDWVLLRDAVRTLSKVLVLIRKAGLKNRMQEPQKFMKEMNKLSIEMSHQSRQKNGKKKRKATLRLMKKLVNKVGGHAEKHKALLIKHWKETGLKKGEVYQIIQRIDNILKKLPEALWQAHERIIGERKVSSKDKMLSLYEEDIHVIVRGKSGAEVEFGNTLLVSEQEDGVIVDFKLFQYQCGKDSQLLQGNISRVQKTYGKKRVLSVTADRGFFSKNNNKYLESHGIGNYLCPLSPLELATRMEEESFIAHQKRRALTEARIGILKNIFLGDPLRSKGFKSRRRSVAWSVLTHNLWVIARLPQAKEEKKEFLKAV